MVPEVERQKNNCELKVFGKSLQSVLMGECCFRGRRRANALVELFVDVVGF
jgi:hypothetical protein